MNMHPLVVPEKYEIAVTLEGRWRNCQRVRPGYDRFLVHLPTKSTIFPMLLKFVYLGLSVIDNLKEPTLFRE